VNEGTIGRLIIEDSHEVEDQSCQMSRCARCDREKYIQQFALFTNDIFTRMCCAKPERFGYESERQHLKKRTDGSIRLPRSNFSLLTYHEKKI
jgi:hypothetical protein